VDRYKDRPSFVAKLGKPTAYALFARTGVRPVLHRRHGPLRALM
jgi:hypothetical protein